ncbi:MAG TPA: response regulator transcription factor [Terracidiphilus sp.]|nr:response regulator transcription factor [Terracidiphilus sp.]
MNSDSGSLLIVDDERAIRLSLRTILENFGFDIAEAARGEEALSLVRNSRFDAVLLDINMPGMGGIEVCRMMRKASPRLPIVMLTVQGSEDRKVEALDAGADDYITKPFQLRELTARLRAAVRRNKVPDDADAAILIGDVLLDPGRHLVEKKGRPVHLTPKQFDLLHYLMVHAGRPIPHAKLLRSVWGPEYGNELEYLRTFIRQIRMKIEEDPANPQYLLTDSHIGYRFSETVSM